MSLEETVALLHTDKSAFFETFSAATNQRRRKLAHAVGAEGIRDFVRYCWDIRWSSAVEIPEQLKLRQIEELVGKSSLSILGCDNGYDILRICLPDYGVFDERKMEFFMEHNESGMRETMSNAFFEGDLKEENAKKIVKYAWERRWNEEVPIPEAVGSLMISSAIGRDPYVALGVAKDKRHDLLRLCIDDYGRFDDHKLSVFMDLDTNAKTRAGYAFYAGEHKDDNIGKALQYAWKLRWSKEKEMPEEVAYDDIRDVLTQAFFKAAEQDRQEILARNIDNFGIFDDEKMHTYLEKKKYSRTVGHAFFRPLDESKEELSRVRENMVRVMRYAFEHVWKQRGKTIPELINQEDVFDVGAVAPYKILGANVGSPQELLKLCFDDYGLFDETKIKVFLERTHKSSRPTLYEAFFYRENREENAVRLLRHCWENLWQQEVAIPEEITGVGGMIGDRLGHAFCRVLGDSIEDIRVFLSKSIGEDYGVLDGTKCAVLFEKRLRSLDYKQNLGVWSESTYLEEVFFRPQNDKREENAELYLEQYQIKVGKRRSELSSEDFEFIPDAVKQILGMESPLALSSVPKKQVPVSRDPSYNVVQIRWNRSLENKLTEMLERQDDPDSFMRENQQLLWQELGVTSFAAHMKAQELGLIPKTVEFGTGPSERLPTYPLIEFEGYRFGEYALTVASSIDDLAELNAHLFLPINRQNFHVNAPIYFRRERSDYTEKEMRILQTIAEYLQDPNQFSKEMRIVREVDKDVETVYVYNAPQELKVTPRIVPVRVGEELITQVFLPARYCADRGGVQTGVLHTGSEEIFLFRHSGNGVVQDQ